MKKCHTCELWEQISPRYRDVDMKKGEAKGE